MSGRRSVWFLVALSILAPGFSRADAGDTFLESDEIEEGEAIANVFLKEADYALMLEDVERNGVAFDWAWVLVVSPESTFEQSRARPQE